MKEAEDLHMILDLSHLSDEGVEDVLSITSCPVIASHSNSRAVAGSNRNLTDCQMREIASRGGTVGLNGCSLLTAGPGVSPDQNGLTAHLDHMTEIMGEDHVALGFDFCDSFLRTTCPRPRTRCRSAPLISSPEPTRTFRPSWTI